MKILTKQSYSCPYIAKELPAIDQRWSIFPNKYFAKKLYWHHILLNVNGFEVD